LTFWVALLLVTGLLLTPSEVLPETGLWDKLEHASAFAALTLLGIAAFPEHSRAWPLALGLVALGAVGEGLQTFVPGRLPAIWDGVANGLGVLAVHVPRVWLQRSRRNCPLPHNQGPGELSV
jgi:VanZ family protein